MSDEDPTLILKYVIFPPCNISGPTNLTSLKRFLFRPSSRIWQPTMPTAKLFEGRIRPNTFKAPLAQD